ncbi:hypothetical protein CBR_g27877 [Chara braunii]|uniref:Uncharacterized protein n=1 Tax=Chara braunii TaxID=69332 RepID=A0A388L8L6_CHABU|nr:hypothetical protein CBR_g27877 [Chara braunii]|eukprot:GBG78651.1 hypothetical protein CBR_g27877 [Chara braunii]
MARTTVVHKVEEVFLNALGGVRGRQNLAAWGVAATAAYFLWVRPEMKAKEEAEARAALREAEKRREMETATKSYS